MHGQQNVKIPSECSRVYKNKTQLLLQNKLNLGSSSPKCTVYHFMQITGSRDFKPFYGHVFSHSILALIAVLFNNSVFCTMPKLRYRPILLILTHDEISIEKQLVLISGRQDKLSCVLITNLRYVLTCVGSV